MSDIEYPFEKLDAHRVAMQMMRVVREIAWQLPVGYADLRHQLLRSARSVHLNIAEGSAHKRPGNKVQRYDGARASAAECASAIREIRLFDLVRRPLLDRADGYLHRLGSMLTRLIEYWDAR